MSESKTKTEQNPMKKVKVSKLTLNIGAGTDQKTLEKGMDLLKHITGIDPVKTYAKKRVPTWGLRPGLPIGCKLTIRGKKAEDLIQAMLDARDNKLPSSCVDDHGNVSFGLKEYIDITGVKYNPDIGMMGLQASITLERPGYRVKKRRIGQGKVGEDHKVNKEDAIQFMEDKFKVKIE